MFSLSVSTRRSADAGSHGGSAIAVGVRGRG
jgi:hypothetical protein